MNLRIDFISVRLLVVGAFAATAAIGVGVVTTVSQFGRGRVDPMQLLWAVLLILAGVGFWIWLGVRIWSGIIAFAASKRGTDTTGRHGA